MYESQVHTPASNCSAGTLVSCGTRGSARQPAPDDFEVQLTRRLELYCDEAANPLRRDDAAQVAEKVSNWRRGITDLLFPKKSATPDPQSDDTQEETERDTSEEEYDSRCTDETSEDDTYGNSYGHQNGAQRAAGNRMELGKWSWDHGNAPQTNEQAKAPVSFGQVRHF
ncbi:hypothetical protein JX265_004021 [Neoarthrinium moseri]|uniref:Uncharacterized protein n=2 Tax=Neoarthrinium moseri TaxID=1658444 RepID=A0A9P9WRI3_9PEZI|nr:hypothetical protein JX265_004021 [Neoarthrinium moseri]